MERERECACACVCVLEQEGWRESKRKKGERKTRSVYENYLQKLTCIRFDL